MLMVSIDWQLKTFSELTTDELYEVLKMRSEVFVVEQDCPYLDMDDKDQYAYHLTGFYEKKPVAYVRILPPGITYDEASIGRVLTSPDFRKNGAGILLMKEAIRITYKLFPNAGIKIGAQLYLLNFYSNLGFKQTSESYLEDNIPHIEMVHSKLF